MVQNCGPKVLRVDEKGEVNISKSNKRNKANCPNFRPGSNPVPLKTRRVGQRCTLNLSRAETSSRWCGVVVRRGGASSGVVHVT
ncbi:hypothetical protein TNCV_632001 [Trichonephila clavipes]|nr:hypothetical protein TNCV_632001 [Trichonephila clavipes]